MATTVSGLSIPLLTPVISTPEVRAHRRRRINPEAGHALEILAHAIEYVTDEYVHEAGSFFGPRSAPGSGPATDGM